MNRTVLVTGGTGYVASWCIVGLLERGYNVRTTVRSLGKEQSVRDSLAKVVDAEDRLTFFAADLMSDDGWSAALDGCDAVLHVASPLGGTSGDADSVIRPAREGALRVLKAAADAGVARVVMTSACVAASPADTKQATVTDETLWTDPDGKQLSDYQRSKVLAERAAWDFTAANDGPTTLTTILPGAVFGPIINASALGSVTIISRLLGGKVPGNAGIALEVVDVRDLAELHILAMESNEAAGERIIGVSGDLMLMADMSQALRDELGDAAAKVPTRNLPDFALRFASLFNGDMKTLTSALGRKHQHSAAKAHTMLGWNPRPGKIAVVDCGKSLIELELV